MRLHSRRMRSASAVIGAFVLVTASLGNAAAITAGSDDKVTGQTFVRHDGGTDDAITHCNDPATSEVPDTDPNDGDLDNNDGGTRRQGNEPFSVIDPTDPDTIVAGWNDYCQTDIGAGWQGFAYSRDGGDTWVDSFVPGYPADTSAEGQASPLFGSHTEAGDPIAAFDSDGNLFVGGISFNRANAINGDVYVAKYTADDVDMPGTTPDYPVNYDHTNIVGVGTPSRNFVGIFEDKPMLEVDRTGGPSDGNVYVCWSRFPGLAGQNKIFFSRSTDSGEAYSRPMQLTTHGFSGSVQGCDIAIEGDGDVYITFRTFNDSSVPGANALYFVRSSDGGATFSGPTKVRNITPYNPFDGSRDCGDGTEACPTGFVFARVPLEPRSTADQNASSDGVFLVYNEVDASTIVDSTTSYSSAGTGRVGRSVVYVVASTDDGATWSAPVKVDNASGVGHQFFPDIDALDGALAVVWQDSRTDACYSVQRPIGNTAGATACADDNVVNAFVASASTADLSSWTSIKVSDGGHQPQYEMFASRSVPFQGDYNWISIVSNEGSLSAYATWTDNRDVIPGVDLRESVQDGFDVLQCRTDLGAEEGPVSEGPRARAEAPFSGDNCGNAGGLDQNIYGNLVTLP
jgi:hypothetical protein